MCHWMGDKRASISAWSEGKRENIEQLNVTIHNKVVLTITLPPNDQLVTVDALLGV